MIQAQAAGISTDIEKTQAIISEKQSPSVLMDEYKDNTSFHANITTLCGLYTGMRKSRGDGNCFYRSYLFSLLETFSPETISERGKEDYEALHAKLKSTTDRLSALGYSSYTCEDFIDSFIEVLEGTRGGGVSYLESFFADKMQDLYVITAARMVTSLYIQENPDQFQPFIEAASGVSVKQFCTSDVEAVNVEVDHLQILALTSFINIGVRIEYLDQSSTSLHHHDFPEGVEPSVHVVYRPGHYDILYR
jgi:ubiquitin thioesterase protein OTUB1